MGAMFVGTRLVLLALVPAACATVSPAVPCPEGTRLARHVYAGGGEAEWCRRDDGARQGPETRFYESGAPSLSGEYSDGALSGVWRYRFNDGRNWRADRWEDGALVDKTVDPAVSAMSPEELARLGPTRSGIIKLASHDALTGRESQERGGAMFVAHHANGRPRVAGRYDADGLRTGVWRFWYEDGRPARELEFLAGVRERGAREWHPNGQLAAEGSYTAGERDGRWRFWDAAGHLSKEIVYGADRGNRGK
jgi:MORN repeat variant